MKSKIAQKVLEIKNNPNINRFYKETITYDYLDFTNKLKSSEFVISCIEKLSSGTVFVLKNSINENFIEYAKNTLTKISKDESEIDTKVLELKNGKPLLLLRQERKLKLNECDYLAMPDYPHATVEIKQSWLDYRQALRNLPSNSSPQLDDNGELTNVTWPTPP